MPLQVIEELHHSLGLPLYFEAPAPEGSGTVSSVTHSFKTLQLHVERYHELRMLMAEVRGQGG